MTATTFQVPPAPPEAPYPWPSPPTTWEPLDLAPIVNGLRDGTIAAPTHEIGAIGESAYLLTLGRVSTLIGGPASGKTWTALHLCAEVISEGHTVVFIDWEDDARGITSRLLDLGANPADVTERFTYIHPDEPYSPQASQALTDTVTSLHPLLIVLDSTGEAMRADGVEQNSDGEVSAWFARLARPLADTGPAVLLLDHQAKNRQEKDSSRYAIGSQRKLAAVNGTAYIQDVKAPFAKGKAGRASLTCSKDRIGAWRNGETVAEVRVTPASRPPAYPDGHPVDVTLTPVQGEEAGAVFRPTVLMERVSQTLENADVPLSVNQVEKRTTGNRKAVLHALTVLVSEGYVTTHPGQRGSTTHSLVRPYREVNDPQSDTFMTPLNPSPEPGASLVPPFYKGGNQEPVTPGAKEPVRNQLEPVQPRLLPFLVSATESVQTSRASEAGTSQEPVKGVEVTGSSTGSPPSQGVYCPHGGPVGMWCNQCPGGVATAA
ncbi:AAA family ATPase [Actinomyces urogenitalis]|uniref:AAA family ATPase n=1 Tax=Actinomyces urogenitalis TaxID=103621 RepID=UPI00254A8820|nr:AAA family ATPase [Actinomyces urogenitalis]MDK8237932.1 AAA family ATPase [Actinomyces urogenitalis]WOO94329.1 AAA family ATPase [Actinomyces urogenitalis]